MNFIPKRKKVIVVGAGPAGMMAAGICAKRGLDVFLLERNDMLGKKLRITGKGRCNITNACNDINEFIFNITSNGKFLFSSLNRFSPRDTINFFEERGLKTKIERGNRVFPLSDKAIDVVNVMKNFVKNSGCRIINARVKELIMNKNKCVGIITYNNEKIAADAVVLATGGLSYPKTGSTGDGYKIAKKVGHTIVPLKPSLVPLETEEKWVSDLQGLSLKNVAIKLIKNDLELVYEDFGEMLFTHFGLSGPLILSASAHIKNINHNKYRVGIDLKPALSFEQLDNRIVRDFSKFSNKDFCNALVDLLPKKLVPIIVNLSKIPSDIKCNQIIKTKRKDLVNLLKNFTINVKNFMPIEEAIITSGGVSVLEINPQTMESKKIKDLYFAGEIIDVDAYTGGFNLQIAFSTGALAGFCAAQGG